jgi:hypothetical protein
MQLSENLRDRTPGYHYPDRLQQILNQLHKRYEHLNDAERYQRTIEAINQMDVSESDRNELLGRSL